MAESPIPVCCGGAVARQRITDSQADSPCGTEGYEASLLALDGIDLHALLGGCEGPFRRAILSGHSMIHTSEF